ITGDGSGGCQPKTCADLGFTCGPNADGCGHLVDCGGCSAGEFCGGGGYSKCGGAIVPVSESGAPPVSCTPATCQSLQYTCGAAGDGCGGALDCGSCTAPQFCGGGGFNKCGGNNGLAPDGAIACAPSTCASLGYTCGFAGDGCGGQLHCGACVSPAYCGGGGFDKCGGSNGLAPDGSVPCTPTTCAALGYTCGPAGDGCGGQIQCGACVSPTYCGGGGFNKCGGNNGLTPDGSVACIPKTCASLGFNCGPAGDGCGGLLQCGSCTGGDICGGAGQPGKCGTTVPCTNLCPKQVQCDGGATTTITGRVLAGVSAWTNLAPDPVPNVLVYVPNAPVTPFSTGAACRQCGADVSGSPLVSTYTDFDGTFTLTNVPAGTGMPLVIQLGRWRRQLTFDAAPCTTNVLPADLNLPRNQGEGDIPLTAISTGHVDALECVLLKMGIDQTEFTPDNGAGRIHIYGGGPGFVGGGTPHGPGATAGAATQAEAALLETGGTFMNYDQIMLPCWGTPAAKTATELANLITYADGGGHFFATHYSYSWLVGNGEFDTVAQWHPNFNNPGATTWPFDVSTAVPPSPPSPHAGTFANWLNLVHALSNFGATLPAMPRVAIANPRHDADGVAGTSTDWIHGADPQKGGSLVEHFTFDTPVGATTQCGHAIFSDFHVANSQGHGKVFPAECDTAFSAQEKILEYMVWDLSSCAAPPPTPMCTPTTCTAQNITCGPAGDGCGNLLQCGVCVAPQTCGGGGVSGQCGAPDGGACTPQTCQSLGIGCGPAGDGCGNQLSCGTCNPPLTCGGGGVAGQCGAPDAGSCAPTTCVSQNIACGPTGDGCGNLLQCGTCVAPLTCGGGGVSGQCGMPDGGTCVPLSCSAQNINCGPAGDGCGNLVECGTCAPPQSCGGGGVFGQCGGIQ
ncbi:MAG: carboxypeptidase-like regulatory domain-containing protein, partial [Myxococcota bacterium]|nr:carboxypeptidase-like regulatory domain-containing protein [Myxococcota bacterium]